MGDTASIDQTTLPSCGRIALVYWRWKSHPAMTVTERFNGNRERALTACPEASTIRVLVGARQARERQFGGRTVSATTLGPEPVSTTTGTGVWGL